MGYDEPLRLEAKWTKVADDAFVAENATVLGDVHLGAETSVWFTAVIRGDTEAIRVGDRSNIQDGTVVHADPGYPVILEEDVTVGHRCTIHGATVRRCSLIGMGVTLMNGCEIGEESIVGAGAVVTTGKRFPPRSLILGMPAKRVRGLTDGELASIRFAAAHYVDGSRQFMAAGHGKSFGAASDD